MEIKNLIDALTVLESLQQGKPEQIVGGVNEGWQIVVLQRGWVVVGDLTINGDQCILKDAAVIRICETDKGLGQLAINGPTDKTKIDKTTTQRFHILAIVTRMESAIGKWP